MARQDVVVFPFDYLAACSLFPELLKGKLPPVVIAGTNQTDIAAAMAARVKEVLPQYRGKDKFPYGQCHFRKIEVLKIDRRNCYLWLQGDWEEGDWKIFDPPWPSMSQDQGSQAEYYAAHEAAGLLVYGLRRHSKTSCHEDSWIELFFRAAGNAILYTDQGEYPLGRVVPIVRPGIGHQLHAQAEATVVVLMIKGDTDWLKKWEDRKAHNYRKLIPRSA